MILNNFKSNSPRFVLVLGTEVDFRENMIAIDFQVTSLKVKVNLMILKLSAVHSILPECYKASNSCWRKLFLVVLVTRLWVKVKPLDPLKFYFMQKF